MKALELCEKLREHLATKIRNALKKANGEGIPNKDPISRRELQLLNTGHLTAYQDVDCLLDYYYEAELVEEEKWQPQTYWVTISGSNLPREWVMLNKKGFPAESNSPDTLIEFAELWYQNVGGTGVPVIKVIPARSRAL